VCKKKYDIGTIMANYTLERDGWESDECEGGGSECVEVKSRREKCTNQKRIWKEIIIIR
jgi:hypothetical protein